MIPAPNKRIKRDASVFDAEVYVDEMLAKFAATHASVRAAAPSRNTADDEDLDRLQAEVDQLQALQSQLNQVLQHRLEKKRRKTMEMKKQRIPLFTLLNDDLLLSLSDFLSGQDFLHLEDAVMNFVPSSTLAVRWLAIKGAHQFKSGLPQRLGKRVARFQEASEYARRIQASARMHYEATTNQRQRSAYEWPQQLYSREDFCSDFKSFQGRNQTLGRMHLNEQLVGTAPETELFVRMTYEEDDGSESVLLEGFRPPKIAANDNPKGNYTTMGFTGDDTYLSM